MACFNFIFFIFITSYKFFTSIVAVAFPYPSTNAISAAVKP